MQTIRTENGDELVVLSRRDHDVLLARAGDQDAEDRMTVIIAAEARGERPLPEAVSSAILESDSILKALRNWRGMTQAELAKKAGVNQGFISEIESRAKIGTAETLGKLAVALDVEVGWLR
jgi:DNA-binding XRE family transcriptional regulator